MEKKEKEEVKAHHSETTREKNQRKSGSEIHRTGSEKSEKFKKRKTTMGEVKREKGEGGGGRGGGGGGGGGEEEGGRRVL